MDAFLSFVSKQLDGAMVREYIRLCLVSARARHDRDDDRQCSTLEPGLKRFVGVENKSF